MSEKPVKPKPWWRIAGIVVQAWTASEARAEYKRRANLTRVPVGVRAAKLPPADDLERA